MESGREGRHTISLGYVGTRPILSIFTSERMLTIIVGAEGKKSGLVLEGDEGEAVLVEGLLIEL